MTEIALNPEAERELATIRDLENERTELLLLRMKGNAKRRRNYAHEWNLVGYTPSCINHSFEERITSAVWKLARAMNWTFDEANAFVIDNYREHL